MTDLRDRTDLKTGRGRAFSRSKQSYPIPFIGRFTLIATLRGKLLKKETDITLIYVD
jgi:hypothetical protein